MSYREVLEEKASETTTLNGAKTHSTSGDACLDFFAVAGGMRYREKNVQIVLFDRAYIENPELAMKLLFYIRDIRGGMGERKMFRTLLRHVAFQWPKSAKKNVAYISEFGRYDDLLCLLGTPAQNEAMTIIQSQLKKDWKALEERRNGRTDARISLLAKWLPSSNTSSWKTRKMAQKVMNLLEMDEKSYRKMLSALRANICITERYLTKKEPEKIVYHSVPAGAMLKYRKAFDRSDTERFHEYLDQVKSGAETIHCRTLFPYEIARPYFAGWWVPNADETNDKLLDILWNHLKSSVNQNNAISVVDTSGSMYCRWPDSPMPALYSQALGLYLAENCTGPFHNMLITFESSPHLIEIQGDTLRDKMQYIHTLPWGWSTNLSAVFDLILDTAIKSGAAQEELPQTIYIFSDMEFDCAIRGASKTVYEDARERYEAYGYHLPAVVFHNVNSWQMQVPVRKDTKGAALVSGQSVSAFRYPTDVNTTPMEHMLQILNSRRYRMIHA